MRRLVPAIVGIVCLLAAAPSGQEPRCKGPGNSVRITAQQLTVTPPAYAFLITNLTDSPLHSIVIGRAVEPSLSSSVYGVPFNLPTSVTSPKRWTGRYVNGDESPYVHYYWNTQDAGAGIPPKKSVSGFGIALPRVPPDRPKQYAWGKEIVQTNFKGLRFEVSTADGKCYWGTVVADLIER
jgi:hypothetical protein